MDGRFTEEKKTQGERWNEMPEVDVNLFHYSATILTDRREVLYAIRGISMAVQRTVNNKIPWRHISDESWKDRHHHATFYFTSQDFRDEFLALVRGVISADSWKYVGISDDQPAPTK
jgi:hypothetical protein